LLAEIDAVNQLSLSSFFNSSSILFIK